MKTKHFNKISYLAIILLGLLVVSCNTDDAGLLEANKANQVALDAKSKVLNFTYHYNGTAYNETVWNVKNKATSDATFFTIGLNENLYLFDTQAQATVFEKGAFQNILKTELRTLEITSAGRAVVEVARATVIYKVELYDNINYMGESSKYYNTMVIKKMKNFWAYSYYADNTAEWDLPTSMKNKTSSYKIELVQTGTVDNHGTTGQPLYLTCNIKFRTGSLGSDRNVDYKSALYKDYYLDNSKREDNDLRNNRIWASLGITTWNDQIEAVQVEFR